MTLIRKKKLKIALIILALIIVAGLIVGGYYWNKQNKKDDNKTTEDNGLYLNPQNDPPLVTQTPLSAPPNESVLGTQTETQSVTPRETPVPPSTVKTYTNQDLRFSIELPSDWVIKTAPNEVIAISPEQARYSVQVYPYTGTGNDTAAFKAFLSGQTNLHNVIDSTLSGYPVLTFDVDGFYQRGYAFLISSRLYYLLGKDIENSPTALTFKPL